MTQLVFNTLLMRTQLMMQLAANIRPPLLIQVTLAIQSTALPLSPLAETNAVQLFLLFLIIFSSKDFKASLFHSGVPGLIVLLVRKTLTPISKDAPTNAMSPRSIIIYLPQQRQIKLAS